MGEQEDKHVIWEEEQLSDEELEEMEKQIDDAVDNEIEDSKLKRAYKSKVLEDGRIEFYS